jgi:hypothetical protein
MRSVHSSWHSFLQHRYAGRVDGGGVLKVLRATSWPAGSRIQEGLHALLQVGTASFQWGKGCAVVGCSIVFCVAGGHRRHELLVRNLYRAGIYR